MIRQQTVCRLVFSALVGYGLLSVGPASHSQQSQAVASNPGELTVDRIFRAPSLSGHLNAGLTWMPDGKRLSYVETVGTGKDARRELWVVDPATGQRSALVPADKWDAALTNPAAANTQATGLGRHAPPLYQWAPSGDAILFQGANSLAWYDLQTQSSRVLVRERKNSPIQKFLRRQIRRFIRGPQSLGRKHRRRQRARPDARRHRRYSQRRTRLGLPRRLDITTAYWWSPDSASVGLSGNGSAEGFPILVGELRVLHRRSGTRALPPVPSGAIPSCMCTWSLPGVARPAPDGYGLGNRRLPCTCKLGSGFKAPRHPADQSRAESA